jgi:kinesin family protein 3/17
MLEIYNEKIRDLLSSNVKNKLDLRENPDKGVYVNDLTEFTVKNRDELHKYLIAGGKNRITGATKMNKDSSRSHSIFTIIVECAENVKGEDHVRVGKLNMVDLAGSERQSKTGATGARFIEAININQSLTTLGNVI